MILLLAENGQNDIRLENAIRTIFFEKIQVEMKKQKPKKKRKKKHLEYYRKI